MFFCWAIQEICYVRTKKQVSKLQDFESIFWISIDAMKLITILLHSL